ncbi:MAG: hypothetical protein IKR78_05425, partial [Dehalococcoidales bacterium]|nr:hypothetical protein [Dehalococcoidales bacterium]
ISIMGADAAESAGKKNALKELAGYLGNVSKLDSKSITNACKAVTFDVWYRNIRDAFLAKQADEIEPDKNTVDNIITMIERSLYFFETYGPITVDGFSFEEKGYTETVSSGDGDFLTKDTLWDFKVTKSEPKNTHTLQLLMYYIMGLHSGKPEYKSIKKLGIFNPRLNKVYTLDVDSIPDETIKEVENDVICYK